MVKHIAFPGVVVLVVSTSTLAQVSLQAVEVIAIQQDQSPSLQATPAVGSRLGLSVRETPASAEVITQEMMERRGARTFEEALRGSAGMTTGGAPGSPSVASTRGFTGGFITYLFDGDRVAVASMVSRPQDTWNYERIEVLKGPASVLYGEGAIGAAVNFVTKRPDRNNPGAEAMLTYGSFGTVRAGVGVNIGGSSAFRLDYSHQETKGYIDRNKQRYDNLTMGFTTALTRDLTLDLTMDYSNDSALSYQGTPLVPRAFALQPSDIVSDAAGRVVDRSIAFRNYNVDDAQMSAPASGRVPSWLGRLRRNGSCATNCPTTQRTGRGAIRSPIPLSPPGESCGTWLASRTTTRSWRIGSISPTRRPSPE